MKRFAPNAFSHDHLTFLQELDQVGQEQPKSALDPVEQLIQSDDVEHKSRAAAIRKAEEAATRLNALSTPSGVKIWSGPLADREAYLPKLYTDVAQSSMEKDFTTHGTPSKLGCPFASGSRRGSLATPRSSTSRLSLRGRRSKRPSFTDPIRAEICGNDPASASPSVAASGSAAVCPIRFLDQHDPEEVAKYFEKHKHELPRSHEICITRFQSNQESIEKLDRKYGNLVNMIQGLGQKHQAWLPEEPEEAVEEQPNPEMMSDIKADAKVQKWATAVSASLQDGNALHEDELQDAALDEARITHFDRPLKEVRLGESPSRPWGITIPAKYTNEDSSSSVGSAPTASPQLPLDTSHPVSQMSQKLGKCPFDRPATGEIPQRQEIQSAMQSPRHDVPTPFPVPPPERQTQTHAQEPPTKEPEAPKVVPQMVFNGPVFLGYPPDQLISLLQNSNLGAGSAMR